MALAVDFIRYQTKPEQDALIAAAEELSSEPIKANFTPVKVEIFNDESDAVAGGVLKPLIVDIVP